MIKNRIFFNQLSIFFFIVLFCLSIFYVNKKNYNQANYTPPQIHGDSHQYLAISVQIFKYKTISHDDPNNKGWPSNYREFTYPLYISIFYNFLNWEYDYSNCLYEKKIIKCENFYQLILFAQIFLLFLTLTSIFFILKKKKLHFFLASIIIIFLFYRKNMIFYFGPEHLSALLLLLTSAYFQKIIYSHKIKDFFICTILLTILIFTKNIFYYLAYLILIISIGIIIINLLKKKLIGLPTSYKYEVAGKFLVVSLISIILLMPYQLRNVYYFNDSSLSKRGKEVLTLRNEFLKADYKTISKGFYYYFPNWFGFKNEKIKQIQDKSFFYEGNPKSYYRGYTKKTGYTINYYNEKNNTDYSGWNEFEKYADDKMMSTNVEIYLNNIIKQSYISILVFFRGMNENYGVIKNEQIKKLIFDLIYYFFLFYFIFGFVKSIRLRNFQEFIFYLPSMYFLFLMSTLTHFEPRMNNTILLIIVLNFFMQLRKKSIE